MVTGASTANLAILLIDVRHGVIEQTKRHAFIASLLQIPHVAVCVNKMDLVVNFDICIAVDCGINNVHCLFYLSYVGLWSIWWNRRDALVDRRRYSLIK